MECYEGATMIKTFRGLIADGGTDIILLHTNDGSTGYRIVNFQIIPNNPGLNIDAVVKIWKVTPQAATATVDFSDNTLLAVAWNYNDTYETDDVIIFDREIFNQDIYVQHHEEKSTHAINYYIELEQMPLALDENTVATLKDIRNTARSIV